MQLPTLELAIYLERRWSGTTSGTSCRLLLLLIHQFLAGNIERHHASQLGRVLLQFVSIETKV